ncbi:2-polyprenyl-6-methoxyphenol hydroxylase-like FAD-dependent oxidoreductase [Nocardia transvalensis]|uniref:2-polyprenyl-6-methoxyphenol hydroxylase-like FAD-dependent oxidoreductase n=1 Tax=Nocardia transvalensis TaxID=37333 RepID=A0A7W9PBP4_9NOCA|nr:FAD-dependent monooxygenase [Nocardia transvalensis]MBB5913122.1 2-polyprenyl-6-methoxyphenol hydroxylase-like FAD-dependent oxidoreductase [Nocardia transvalensis]
MDRTRSNGRALIVGLGIAGTATAIRLRQIGWTPVVVERAAGRRTGGYFVGLFGTGRAAAARLGILDGITNRAAFDGANFQLDRHGNRRRGLGFKDLPGRPWMMLRGDIEQAAYAKLPAGTDIRYSTTPTRIDQDADGVTVTLTDTAAGASVTERFDLVIGADGVHSTVRSLAFGPPERYLRRLDYVIAAFRLERALSDLADGDGATLLEPNRSMWIFPFADRPSTVLMSYRTDDVDAELGAAPADRMRTVFGTEPLGRTLEEVLAALEATDEVLFDAVEQVRMDSWHRGRVVLVGDAAWCVSLYSGMGASAGLTGAQLLGTMLRRHPGDPARACAEWDRALRPAIEYYQRLGRDMCTFFTPANRRQIRVFRILGRLQRDRRTGPAIQRIVQSTKASRMKERDLARTGAPR